MENKTFTSILYNESLTGKWQHRRNWFGSLVIYVEIQFTKVDARDPFASLDPVIRKWRKASRQDLIDLQNITVDHINNMIKLNWVDGKIEKRNK